jgi:RES domain-containing protein
VVLLYRISKTEYATDLRGEGARLFGGRWNLKGTPVIYLSDSTALATLETLVHFSWDIVPKNRSIITLNLPDDLPVFQLNFDDLPEKWWVNPAPPKLARIGQEWIERRSEVALAVPSSVTPQGEGRNYILNPKYPDFAKIEIISVTEYRYDSRFFRN